MTHQMTSEAIEKSGFIELAMANGIALLRSIGARRKDARLLAGMNDHALADIGLRREQIQNRDIFRW